MLYSFDVFDTLITRTTALPTGIFALMQERLLHDEAYGDIPIYIRGNFYELRIHAEELARTNYQKNGVDDVTLEQIYEAMATNGCLEQADLERFAMLERELECVNVVGIEQNIARLRSLVQAGEHVVLISDMYLDGVTIRKMLQRADPVFSDLPLYVSSDYRKGKYSGQLYDLVREQEMVSFAEWHHLGDNQQSDVSVPAGLGIQAEHFSYASLAPVELDRLEGHADEVYTELCIGAARNARLLKKLQGPAVIGSALGGPILFAYVQWILKECERRGIRRLYFIARDGYISKRIADILIRQWNLDLTTAYIYGSRKAWRLPSYSGQKGELRKILAWSYPGRIISPQHLARTLYIPYQELKKFLPLEYRGDDVKLSYIMLCKCVEALEEQEDFRRFYLKLRRPERLMVEAYLQQEIDVQDADFAFVDLGGGGLTQGCLAELMRGFCDYPVRTFFFKMDRINLMKNCIYYNFLPSKLKDDLIIEMLCRAPNGQTEGYIEESGQIIPVLKHGEGELIAAHGYDDYVQGIEAFVREFSVLADERHLSVQISLLLQYMDYLMSRPDSMVLDFIADMPNSVTGREKKVIGFAERLTKQNIRDVFLFHVDEPCDKYYKGSDLTLAQLRCTAVQKRKIRLYQEKRQQIIERFYRIMHHELVRKKGYWEEIFGDVPLYCLGKRFAIYGAGKWGKRLYPGLCSEYTSVVGWLDKNYLRLRGDIPELTGSMDTVSTLNFDIIIIAIADEKIMQKVRAELMGYGVPDDKILWMQDIRARMLALREEIGPYLSV